MGYIGEMFRMIKTLFALCLMAGQAFADNDRAGEFDYYVLALSWSPSWCAEEGDARGSDQCHPRHDFGFTLHGLWPQYEKGWPSFCRTTARDPSRSQTNAMADIMGTGGLAWYQWKKHGRCSGLSAVDYFALSRRAYDAVVRPPVLRGIKDVMSIPPKVIEAAFLEQNHDLTADGVTVTCKSGRLQEVRVCLTRDLTPRDCAVDVVRDCRARSVKTPPIR